MDDGRYDWGTVWFMACGWKLNFTLNHVKSIYSRNISGAIPMRLALVLAFGVHEWKKKDETLDLVELIV